MPIRTTVRLSEIIRIDRCITEKSQFLPALLLFIELIMTIIYQLIHINILNISFIFGGIVSVGGLEL
jgi:hypothetical protein